MLFLVKSYFSGFCLAFTFLTNFNLPFFELKKIDNDDVEKSFVFYPLIGLLFGLLMFVIAALEINIEIKTFFVLVLPFIINKFLHFDGLCDVIDAFLANRTVDQRLIILKDSKIGSFALGGGALFLLFKYILLKSLISVETNFHFIIIIPAIARLNIILLAYSSNYPRNQGAGLMMVGKIKKDILMKTLLMFLCIVTVFLVSFNLQLNSIIILFALIFVSFVFTIIIKKISNTKINGVTGDVLGANVELLELLLLFLIVIFSKGLG